MRVTNCSVPMSLLWKVNIFIFEEQNNKIKVRFRLRSESVCKNRQYLIASSQRLIKHGGDNGVKLNELVYLLSKNLISRYGSPFEVDNLKLPGRKFKLGNYFINAAEISRDLGYKYVEGIAVCKTSGDVICHAWNIDKSERAVDVTFTKTTNYDYFGIEIPFSQIWQIGKMNGGIWYCSLPYLKK